MISKIDIERRKTGIDYSPSHNNAINKRLSELSDYELKIVKSKKFSKFMQKLIKYYAEGEEGAYLPFLAPRMFPELAVAKFNSYGLECRLVYDYLEKSVFFVKKMRD